MLKILSHCSKLTANNMQRECLFAVIESCVLKMALCCTYMTIKYSTNQSVVERDVYCRGAVDKHACHFKKRLPKEHTIHVGSMDKKRNLHMFGVHTNSTTASVE